jgi:hypothetical protein
VTGDAAEISVLVRTVLRPTLARAVRSIYAQDFAGAVQIVLGVDAMPDPLGMIDQLRAECPARMEFTVFDLGYATSIGRGGLYGARSGGVLPVLLAYAARARRVIFLDDDNWAAPDHLSALAAALDGFDWAYTLRWFAAERTGRTLAVDQWESVGPAKGIFAKKLGGFVDLNCLMFDKLACHYDLPVLAVAPWPDGGGHDRLLFRALCAKHSVGWTGRPTVYYTIRTGDPMHAIRRRLLGAHGIALHEAPPG